MVNKIGKILCIYVAWMESHIKKLYKILESGCLFLTTVAVFYCSEYFLKINL